jgi:hypothetical protein
MARDMETPSTRPSHTEDGTPISDKSFSLQMLELLGLLIAFAGGALTVLAMLIGILYGIVVLLNEPLAATTLSNPLVKIAVCVAMTLGAIGLYVLKVSRVQVIFGLVEVAIGLVVNWHTLDSLSHQLSSSSAPNSLFERLALLGAGVYLIGRGIGNFMDGFRKVTGMSWSILRAAAVEGYNRPPRIPIPRILFERSRRTPSGAPSLSDASAEQQIHDTPPNGQPPAGHSDI